MKISIESNTPIKENFLVDLAGNRIDFKLDEHFSRDEGWYELNLPYTGQRTEIKDVKLNDESIEHTLYTGYYMDGNGTHHQPAAAMWDDGGVMKLWLIKGPLIKPLFIPPSSSYTLIIIFCITPNLDTLTILYLLLHLAMLK